MAFSFKKFFGLGLDGFSHDSGGAVQPVSSAPSADATTPSSPSSSAPTNIPTDELAHINQEMYKKSAELAERNKALSLLQKINQLILGSITHAEEISQQVTNLLVTEIDFQIAKIFLYDKERAVLKRLASSQVGQALIEAQKAPAIELSLSNTDNLIVHAVKERMSLFTNSMDKVAVEPLVGNIEIKSVYISPLFVRNELIGAIVIGLREEDRDITEYRRLLLAQLAELVGIGIDNSLLYNEVQNANQRLKDLDKLKDEFVSVASHELRTPMTAIKSYLWMALEGKGGELNEKQHYYVERGYNSVDRLIRLVNDMLNISRIESGRITVEFASIDLIKLTEEVAEEVMPRANELGIKLIVEKKDGLPNVLADSDKIKEVLFNLIGNSLKFTPRDGSITVSFDQKDGFVQTKIVDTGSGIEPEDITKLFQKFGLMAGSYTTNQAAMGTGLGLYITRSIVTIHEGKIWAESPGRGKGATFTFLLKKFEESDFQRLHKSDTGEKDPVGLIHSQI